MVYMTKQRSEKIANSSVPVDTMHLEKVRSCECICFQPMSQERGWKPHNALRYELLRYLEKLFVDICSLATSLFRPQRPQIWLRWGEMYIKLLVYNDPPQVGRLWNIFLGHGDMYGLTYYMIPRNPIPRQYEKQTFYGPSHIVSLVPT